MPSTTIVYATDIHGSIETYETLFSMGSKRGIGAVVIGGDVLPGYEVVSQKNFLKDYLLPRIAAFRSDTGRPVFLILGNDDIALNMPILEKAHKANALSFIHCRSAAFGPYHLLGYGFINRTPFHFPDWEKDDGDILSDLKKLSKPLPAANTVLVAHVPPLDTGLDLLYTGDHAGSSGIRKWIETFQPRAAFFGHIHESPDLSGVWKEKIGRTVCINPGNANVVTVDLRKPEGARRKKMY